MLEENPGTGQCKWGAWGKNCAGPFRLRGERMTAIILVVSFVLLLAGCSKKEQPERVGADNTGRNVRDRSSESVTAGDQSESESDRKITQNIRQAVVADDSMSTNAKNIKIITIDGAVTLRGPVKSEKEKADIGAKAEQVAGVKRVDNQLEIVAR